MAGLNDKSGWVPIHPKKTYRFISFGSTNSKFFEYGVAVPNWQGATFFRFFIASSYMDDTSDIKTAMAGAVGPGVNIYRSGLAFYISLSGETNVGRIKLFNAVTIGNVSIDTTVVESSLPNDSVKII